MAAQPAWHVVLRALREARGASQEGWAARLGYSRRTLVRWEQGDAVPDAAAEGALIALCQEQGLFRSYDLGSLAGCTVTAVWLQALLASARLGSAGAAWAGLATPMGGVATPATNLPLSVTSFIGREQELADLTRLLDTARLLTLTGAGGAGKTRLALQVASAQAAAFPDGVCFVDLALLQDPTLVPSAVAQNLGVQGFSDTQLREIVLRFVRGKRLLLLLDNYEHLLAAAEFAEALLQAGPGLTLLVTSRAPLRVPGEREYAVPPLPLPPGTHASLGSIAANPAVALFVQRAQAVRAEFRLTAENAAAVVAICTRLDGLPLAIELAAARIRVLPPAPLLARLEQRLPLLSDGARTVPARHHALRDAIAWSYALLEPDEQRLFRRLSVFAGGCTVELAEAVCNADGDHRLDVLDGVSALIEKSLLREVDGPAGEPRYRMLETIREFALEELEASGEAEAVRRQLVVQVLQFARGCAAAGDLRRLDAELDNALAVLGWCVTRVELGLGARLFWALRYYLYNRGLGIEMEAWRQRLLALPEAAQPNVSRARLLALAPFEWFPAVDAEGAAAELAEAIALSREVGDAPCLAQALHRLALLRLEQGQYDAVVLPAEEALALYLQAGDLDWAVTMRSYLVTAAVARGDSAAAERLVAANRAHPSMADIALAVMSEATLAEALGDGPRARVLAEEAACRLRAERGEKSPDTLLALARLARATLRQGDTGAAVATCGESLAVQLSLGPTRFLPAILSVLAQAGERASLLAESARLLAAVDVQQRHFAAEMLGLPEEQQAAVARVRAALGGAAFAAAWARGEALSADAAIEFGLAVVAELQQLLADTPDAVAATNGA